MVTIINILIIGAIGIVSVLSFPVIIWLVLGGIMKIAIKVSKIENMSEVDYKKDNEYYRDILKEYTPAELSYIDDFSINAKREIVSTILNLKLKRKIEITDNKIIVLDSNTDELRKSEKFILQNIQDGKVIIDNDGYIVSYAQDEAIEDELIKQNKDKKNKLIKRKYNLDNFNDINICYNK